MKTLRITLIAFLFISSNFGFAQSSMFTAREHYDEVLADVTLNHGNNVRLILVQALYLIGPMQIVLDPLAGTAEAWIYGFYSPDDQQLVSGFAVDHPQKGTFIGELESEAWNPAMDTTRLPSAWIDSDAAAAAWSNHGVSAFLNAHPMGQTIGFVLITSADNGPTWGTVLTDTPDTLTCSVNAVTADIIDCGLINNIADISKPSDFQLADIYPNPVNQGNTVIVDVTSLTETRVVITIFDIQGQLITTAFANTIHPGTTKITIPSSLLTHSGLYIMNAQSKEGIISRKLMIVR